MAASRTVLNWVGGRALPAAAEAALPLISSATGAQRGTVCASAAADVEAAVAAARAAGAKGPWATLEERCQLLREAAARLEQRLPEFAAAESEDTGKPLGLTRAVDVPRAVANLRFFAGLAVHASDAEFRRQDGRMAALSYAVRRPAGVVALVTPWNLPLYLLTWKLAPALAMGNTVVAKPSELTPSTATMLAELLQEVGLPDGVFNVIHGLGTDCGTPLVKHPHVSAVSFTGGTKTGALVAAAAAPQFKKLSLELGGKNSSIVFADCDMEAAVAGVLRAAFLNSGQVCLCGSRVLIQRGFYERFTAALTEAARALVVGDPADATTDMGPLISAQHREKVASYAALALHEGGELLCGGGPPANLPEGLRGGAYFAPTIVSGLGPTARCSQEEVFGPFVTLHPFDDEDEAVAIANGTQYGLAANLWTESLGRAHSVAGRLEAGTVWVNCWLHRELHMPFGGLKNSGVAREGGVHSLNFYSETSTICVKLGDKTPPPMPGHAGRVASKI
eukprot:TRINITY_DN2060_c0_g1_i5.p1 TRINITY_DN2060_c0_g1~~TRINITY_DN2060_c0_g1_i5.p1  ORF type:complete len:535 (+),score=163.40 TRINITY_DN2060_c0_g1_i5:85-1605(+)